MKLHILIWKYICQYKYTAIVFIIFTLIFAGIFSLYNLETEAVLYAAILCLSGNDRKAKKHKPCKCNKIYK